MSQYCRICVKIMPKTRKGYEQVCPDCKSKVNIGYYKVSDHVVRVHVRIPGRQQIIDLSYEQWEQLHKAVKEMDLFTNDSIKN